MSSNEDRDLKDLRQHQLREDMVEAIDFTGEHLDRARDEALKAIAEVESLPHPSRSEAEGDAKSRALQALNTIFVEIFRGARALEQAKTKL